MMERFLLGIGALTLGGSAAILLLALAGWSTRARYGARWRCWAWGLLCLRLALPFPLLPALGNSAPVQVPLPPAVVQRPQTEPADPPSQGETAPPTAPPSPNESGTAQPVQRPEKAPVLSPAGLIFLVWLCGAAAILLWNTAAHLRFLSYLRRWSSPVGDNGTIQLFNRLGDRLQLDRRPRLLTCQGLSVPMLAGLLRPALLLPPEELPRESLHCALLHELTHFRRRDIWLKTLALWVKALYWFNPLSWLMCHLIQRDTELACDEEALRRLPPDEYGTYGETILTAVERLNGPRTRC